MSNRCTAWLPQSALDQPGVRGALQAVITEWSEAWFSSRRLRLLDVQSLASDPARDVTRWRVRGGLAVEIPSDTLVDMASWALDAELARLELSDADQQVVDLFSEQLISALIDDLTGVLQPGDATARSAVLVIGDEAGRQLVKVRAPQEALVRLRLAQTPKAQAPRQGLEPLGKALAETPVDIHILLGRSELDLADARKLAAGDVLVLKRQVNEPIDVFTAGRKLASATPQTLSSPLSLVLIDPSVRTQ